MHQFKEKSEQQRELVSAGLLLLSRPPGGRRPRLSSRRGSGRRRPAPAHRADARHRRALQRALRRRPRRSRGQLSGGRRPDHEPPGPGDEDVDHLRLRAGDRLHPRRGRRGAKEDPQRGDRLGRRGPPRPRQGGDHEPDRDPLGDSGGRARGGGARVRRLGLRRLQVGGRRRRRRVPGPDPRALRESCAATRPPSRRSWPSGAEKARAIASETLADVREAMGIGPSRR